MHPAVEAGLSALGATADDLKVRSQSAAQAVAGTGRVFDPRVGLWAEYHLFNQTPYKEPRTNPPRIAIIHETATSNATGRSLNARHTRSDLPQQNRSSWNDMIERDGTLLLYTDQVAWHAGKSAIPWGIWAGQGSTFVRLNAWGLELLGRNNGEPVTEPQKDTLARRLRQLELNYNFQFDRENSLFEHTEIDQPDGRKSDSRGCNADEIMMRVIDLRRLAQPPSPDRPPIGEYFINVAIGLLRADTNRKAEIKARLPRGTRVFINEWLRGEVVQGDAFWGDTHPQEKEVLHRSTVKQAPPRTLRTLAADTFATQRARAEVFMLGRMPVLSVKAVELVDCGGYAED